ncbi:MAG: hypothetical protein U1D67_10055, partial [Dehalococcoidia bacterium]|nr:hypothetical protein [Dehalococcoidia bacterium]
LALGLPEADTVGDMREDMSVQVKKGKFEAGLSNPDYVEYKIHEALVESEHIDLLAMGRPEGPGCYCAANNMLRDSIDRLSSKYDYVVIDNEAGMEHISRQTTRDVDILLIIADTSLRSLITAGRIKGLIKELRTRVDKIALILNRVGDSLSDEMRNEIAASGLEIIGRIPQDPNITDLDSRGVPVVELPPTAPSKMKVMEILKKLGLL